MANGTIIKVDKSSNYTVMSNQHFHVTNMSLRAKGLLSLILSLPQEWDYSIMGLSQLCSESYDTVKKVLDELKDLGYLEVIKHEPCKDNNGRFTYEYIVHENSILKDKLDFKWKHQIQEG